MCRGGSLQIEVKLVEYLVSLIHSVRSALKTPLCAGI